MQPASLMTSKGVDGESSSAVHDALCYLVAEPDNEHATITPENSGLPQVQVDPGALTVSDAPLSATSASGPSFWTANATADATNATTKPNKKKRRRDRNRPIHEINRLQLQVKEMEAQLKDLRPESTGNSKELPALKEENDELKKKLKRSFDSTAAVEQLMQTQADKLLQALPKSLVVSGENLVYDLVEDDAVFQVLARTVDEHYLDMNRVLGEAGVRDATSEIFDARVSRPTSESGNDCVLKTRTCAFLPYAIEHVEKAMWRRLESESAILPENVESSRDLVRPYYCWLVFFILNY